MKYWLLIISLLFSQLSFSQDRIDDLIQELTPGIELSNAEMRILRQELKIQSLLIESILELQIDGVNLANPKEASSTIRKLIVNATESRTLDLGERVQNNVKELIEATLHPSKIESQIGKVSKFVLRDLLTKKQNITSLARRYGLQVGLFYLITMQIDYTIPIALMITGTNVPLGATLFSLPISSSSTALFASLKSSIKYIHLMRRLGIKDYLKGRKLTKRIQGFLNRNLFKTDHIIEASIRNNFYTFTVRDSNYFNRMLTRLGYNKNLTYESLVQFLRQENTLIHKLNQIEPKGTSRLARMLELIHEIEKTGNTEILFKMKKRFGANIRKIKSIPELTHHLDYFVKLAHSRNFDEVLNLLRDIPPDIPAKAFGNVWRNYVIGQLSRSIETEGLMGTYKAFRKLHSSFDSDMAHLFLQSKETGFQGDIRNKFVDYLYDSLYTLNSCEIPFKMKKGARAPLL